MLTCALSAPLLVVNVSAQQVDSTTAANARADSSKSTTLRTVQVRGRADNLIGIATSASQGRIGRADLRLRPLQREGELLEAVPAMILTQHSGDGKANQMVVRGFNLDHGTDFQTRLESMPLNLPTHGHGYTDLNPLIPEFVDHLEYKLGPMYAELGDFGSAGGDQINQTDHRTLGGVNAELTRVGVVSGVAHVLRTGVQLRGDDIAVGLYRSDRRVRGDTVRRDNVEQGSIGGYASLESQWRPRLRTVLGLRQDGYAFRVQSNDTRNSGLRLATIGSPKVSLIFAPVNGTELYLGAGLGFHSNDARGTTIRFDPVSGDSATQVSPLVRSLAAEIGVRTSRGEWLRTTASLWTLDLASELLFVGDAGTTEALGRTRRVGMTMANYWKPMSALGIDTDVSFTRARFADVGSAADRIPGALERVIAAGATWEPLPGVHAVARVRHFGASALVEDNSVRGTPTTLLNLSVGGTIRGIRLTASVLNAGNARSSDVQYFYASRLAGESSSGVADVHSHPVEPRMLRLGISRGF